MNDGQYSIIPARPFFGTASSWAYKILKHVEPGIMLDIGAAKGAMTKKMLLASPESTVYSYEPFPGNWPIFEKDLADISGWTLIRKAVSDQNAQLPFCVPQVVSAGLPNWEDSVGYSSTGHLVIDGKGRIDLMVDTIRLDDEGYDSIRFMKVDVQGGERNVIAGARRMIASHTVDMILLECDGDDPETVKEIMKMGYICFDGGYSVIRAIDNPMENWEIIYNSITSTGNKMIGGWPISRPTLVDEYCQWLVDRRSNEGYTWNDLLFVSPRYVSSFLIAGGVLAR